VRFQAVPPQRTGRKPFGNLAVAHPCNSRRPVVQLPAAWQIPPMDSAGPPPDPRAERLKQALRDNLRRRKARDRATAADRAPPAED
jgi:hypothetical protein